jgi:ferredoxin
MAIMITDECINCGACEPECPNNAIYEGGTEWRFADGTSLSGQVNAASGQYEAGATQKPVQMDTYYIVSDKCTECVGLFFWIQLPFFDSLKKVIAKNKSIFNTNFN